MDFLATPCLWVLYDTPRASLTVSPLGKSLCQWGRGQQWALYSAIALLIALPEAQAAGTGQAFISPPPGYSANVRGGPGTQFAVVNTLPDGAPVALNGRTSGDWVQLNGGNWVAASLVRPTSRRNASASVTREVRAGRAFIAPPPGYNVNIRQGPGTQFRVATVLGRGNGVALNGRSQDGWVQLAGGNWVAGNLIQVERPSALPTPPVSEPNPSSGFLRLGSRGPAVGDMQRRLQELGYLPANNPPTSVFGQPTEQAIRAFQRQNGLATDGIAGPQTLGVLYSSAAAAQQPRQASAAPQPPTPGPAPNNQPAAPVPPATNAPATDAPATNAPASEDPAPAAETPPVTDVPLDRGTATEARIMIDGDQDALIFSGPGTENDLLGYLPSGTVVNITGNFQGGWAELADGTWTYQDWLELS